MKKSLFNQLWMHHPGMDDYPCDKTTFPNQCAIRMSVALDKSGIDTSTFDQMYLDRRCYSGFNHFPRHILAAQELANWLKSQTKIFGEVKINKKITENDLPGKQGIIFIKHGWGTVDHIDVWNGVRLKGGLVDYLSVGKELWFWEAQQ